MIVVGARNPEKNAAAVKELEALGARAIAIPTDVRDEKQCRALIDKAAQEFGRLDILVNNSGMNYRSPPESYTMDQWKEVMDVNLTSAFVCSQAAYPHFVKAKGGKIINIGFDDDDLRIALRHRLCRQQGRHRADGPRDDVLLGQGQHPDQLDPAGLDRYRPHPLRTQGSGRAA